MFNEIPAQIIIINKILCKCVPISIEWSCTTTSSIFHGGGTGLLGRILLTVN